MDVIFEAKPRTRTEPKKPGDAGRTGGICITVRQLTTVLKTLNFAPGSS